MFCAAQRKFRTANSKLQRAPHMHHWILQSNQDELHDRAQLVRQLRTCSADAFDEFELCEGSGIRSSSGMPRLSTARTHTAPSSTVAVRTICTIARHLCIMRPAHRSPDAASTAAADGMRVVKSGAGDLPVKRASASIVISSVSGSQNGYTSARPGGSFAAAPGTCAQRRSVKNCTASPLMILA